MRRKEEIQNRFVFEGDGADVGGTDSSDREETVLPLTNKTNTLVDGKERRNSAGDDGGDGQEIAHKVVALSQLELSGSVDTMVITRGQVDDGVEDLVFGIPLLGYHSQQRSHIIVQTLHLFYLVFVIHVSD